MKPESSTNTADANRVGSTGGSASDFLTAEQIPIGSWWKIAQGGEYGYCVTAVDVARREATVLSTKGEVREIDTFKLQCRYSRVLPNTASQTRPAEPLNP